MSALVVFLKAVESGAKTAMSSCGGGASAGTGSGRVSTKAAQHSSMDAKQED